MFTLYHLRIEVLIDQITFLRMSWRIIRIVFIDINCLIFHHPSSYLLSRDSEIIHACLALQNFRCCFFCQVSMKKKRSLNKSTNTLNYIVALKY